MTIDNQLVSSIGKGVLVLAGVSEKDTRKEVEAMASKVLKMKMWPDDQGANVCLTMQFNCFECASDCTVYSLALVEA